MNHAPFYFLWLAAIGGGGRRQANFVVGACKGRTKANSSRVFDSGFIFGGLVESRPDRAPKGHAAMVG
jgi:hypothetical protein